MRQATENKTMAAIVIAKVGDELEVYGPFETGTIASRWGFENLKEPACDGWHWQDLIEPTSPYATREPLLDRG
jgi:hypothetical protein